MTDQTLPQSPDDMPMAFHNSERELRNLLVTLDRYACVDIHWERNDVASADCGETVGEWKVRASEEWGRLGRVKD